jgi:regulator of replication initiation timing
MSMTESLLQKLEEKMMMLISEVEELRKEIQHLNHENASLRAERENHSRKLQELISLLDTVTSTSGAVSTTSIAA